MPVRSSTARYISVLLLLAASPSPGVAQRSAASWLATDNDVLALWRDIKSDRDYTAGLQLGVAVPLAPGLKEDGSRVSRTLVATLTQQIYTPDLVEPLPSDRSYAAVLTAGTALQWESAMSWREVGVGLFVTGPPAFGNQVQSFVHRVIDSPQPMGWGDQLPFEAGISVAYAGARQLAKPRVRALNASLVARWGAQLGTATTSGFAGLRTTLGLNAPRAWLSPLPPSSGVLPIRFYVLAGAQLDVVGRVLVLDGSTFSDEPGVGHRMLVPRTEAGLALEVHRVTVSWVGHIDGQEWDGQPGPHRYGTFRIMVQ